MKMIEVLKNPKHRFAMFPILITTAIVLSLWLWQSPEYDVSPLVSPPVAEAGSAVPQTIVTVAQGQVVGDEAYWKGFRLNRGWHLAETGDYGRYTLVADVTNTMDTPDTARAIVQVRVADRDVDMLMCRVSLDPGETKAMICADTAHASYTSRWTRITISAV